MSPGLQAAQEQADLAAHEEILASLMRTADAFLPQHPQRYKSGTP